MTGVKRKAPSHVCRIITLLPGSEQRPSSYSGLQVQGACLPCCPPSTSDPVSCCSPTPAFLSHLVSLFSWCLLGTHSPHKLSLSPDLFLLHEVHSWLLPSFRSLVKGHPLREPSLTSCKLHLLAFPCVIFVHSTCNHLTHCPPLLCCWSVLFPPVLSTLQPCLQHRGFRRNPSLGKKATVT